MTVIIGPLRAADVARCAELEKVLFAGDQPWSASDFVAVLAQSDLYYVAARIGERLIGYAGMATLGAQPPFEYEVHNIGVDPVYQGRGVGRMLLDHLLERAVGGPVYLEVRTDNEAAIHLYRRAGFVEVGLRKGYYPGSGADAYTMRRPG